MLTLALGALATLRATLQVSIMGIMIAITTTTIVITTKADPTGTTTARPPVDRCAFLNKCLSASWR